MKSNYEIYISYWLEELKNNNFILDFKYESVNFILGKELGKIMKQHKYTPDFVIQWNKEKINKLNFLKPLNTVSKKHVLYNENYMSFFEIKPEFDRFNMVRIFNIIQPIIFEKYNVFVQKIIPLQLFKISFIPQKILHTFYYSRGNKSKKYNFEYKTLQQIIG